MVWLRSLGGGELDAFEMMPDTTGARSTWVRYECEAITFTDEPDVATHLLPILDRCQPV